MTVPPPRPEKVQAAAPTRGPTTVRTATTSAPMRRVTSHRGECPLLAEATAWPVDLTARLLVQLRQSAQVYDAVEALGPEVESRYWAIVRPGADVTGPGRQRVASALLLQRPRLHDAGRPAPLRRAGPKRPRPPQMAAGSDLRGDLPVCPGAAL